MVFLIHTLLLLFICTLASSQHRQLYVTYIYSWNAGGLFCCCHQYRFLHFPSYPNFGTVRDWSFIALFDNSYPGTLLLLLFCNWMFLLPKTERLRLGRPPCFLHICECTCVRYAGVSTEISQSVLDFKLQPRRKWNLTWYDIFVNCNWVNTRWQWSSTHLHTNNIEKHTMKQNT